MHHLLALNQPADPTTYIAILLGGFVLLYLSILRPMMKKRKDPLEQPPARSGLAQQRAVERDMQHLLIEYEQMIRNMTAGVDTRAAKLEALIQEADEKIAALRALSAGAAAAPASAPRAGEPQAVTSVAVEAKPSTTAGPDPRHADVYALADQGLSARDVARRLGRPNGEIELILALRAGRE